MAVLRKWLLGASSAQVLKEKGVRETLGRIREHYVGAEGRFVRENYPAGNQGVQLLRNRLIEHLKLE
jgi:hypothetical protein